MTFDAIVDLNFEDLKLSLGRTLMLFFPHQLLQEMNISEFLVIKTITLHQVIILKPQLGVLR